MTAERFLNARVTLYPGDCLEVLAGLDAGSIDACVTDPPYGLSFMGKHWDHGVPGLKYWREVFRVLKPGAHLLAFGGTRTYHRMACAIEDAGFEIRDQIGWAYGSGFPKSLDVSKAIDKRGGSQVAWFGPWFRKWREDHGISQKQVAVLFPSKSGGLTGCVANWELGLNMPTPDQFNAIRDAFGLPFETITEAEREVIGSNGRPAGWFTSGDGHDITAPATHGARQWDGFGTALKPAWEPIVLARKPLIGTVAENVLKHGTGALNIDGCRVESADIASARENEQSQERRYSEVGGTDFAAKPGRRMQRQKSNRVTWEGGQASGFAADHVQPTYNGNGRWPANLVHDGSAEVLAAFPESEGCQPHTINSANEKHEGWGSITNKNGEMVGYEGKGSAARFFYTAKADANDRLGSKHPTVKPLDLMQWLVRLVCPPGGTCIDPFAGTGTTGEAAWREGMRAVLIEREAEYQSDIRRRLALSLAGPEERQRASIKASGKLEDAGPLFAAPPKNLASGASPAVPPGRVNDDF